MASPPDKLMTLIEQVPLASRRPWIGYASAIAGIGAAVGGRQMLQGMVPEGYPFLTFFPVVIIIAFFFGRGPALPAQCLGGAAAWYLFIPLSVMAAYPGVVTAMLFYSFIAAVDIFLIDLAQKAAARAIAERERNRALAETRELLFNELQHRVSNNLQVIGSLLSAQKRRIVDAGARQARDEAANRLTDRRASAASCTDPMAPRPT